MSEYKSNYTNHVTTDKYTHTDRYHTTNSTSQTSKTSSGETDLYFLKNLNNQEICEIIENNKYKKNYSLYVNIESKLSNIFYDYFCHFTKKKIVNIPNVDDYKNLFLKDLYNISFWDSTKKDREFSKFANWLVKYKNIYKNYVNKLLFVYLIVELFLLVDDQIFIKELILDNTEHIMKNLQTVGLDLYNCNLEFLFYKTTKRLARFLYENIEKIIPENKNAKILENIFTYKRDMIRLCSLSISSSIPIKQIFELNVKLNDFQKIFRQETQSLIKYKTKLQTGHENNVYKVLSYIDSDDENTFTSISNKDSSNYLKDFFVNSYSPYLELQEMKNIKLPEEYHIKKLDEESDEIKYIDLHYKKK